MRAGRDPHFTGCYNCDEKGHFQQDYRKPLSKGDGKNNWLKGKKGKISSKVDDTAKGKKGGKGKKLWSVPENNTYNDVDSYKEEAPHPDKGRGNVAAAQAPSLQLPWDFCLRPYPTANA